METKDTRVDTLLEEYEAQNGKKHLDEKIYLAYKGDCCDCDCCDCDCDVCC